MNVRGQGALSKRKLTYTIAFFSILIFCSKRKKEKEKKKVFSCHIFQANVLEGWLSEDRDMTTEILMGNYKLASSCVFIFLKLCLYQ